MIIRTLTLTLTAITLTACASVDYGLLARDMAASAPPPVASAPVSCEVQAQQAADHMRAVMGAGRVNTQCHTSATGYTSCTSTQSNNEAYAQQEYNRYLAQCRAGGF